MDILDKVVALIEKNNKFDKPNILIISQVDDCVKVIRNLFDRDFKSDSIGPLVSDTNKISLGKNVDITYSDDFNIKLNKKEVSSFDYTIVCVSCIKKRFKDDFLENLKGFTQKIKKIAIVLTDIEFLDERELREIKDFLKSKLNDIELLTIMGQQYEKKENETVSLIHKIAEVLGEEKLISFYKSQSVVNSYKKEFASKVIDNFKKVLSELEENIDEKSFKYIANKFASELASAYGFEDTEEILDEVIFSNIEKILDIRRTKVKAILEEQERKRNEELARIEAEKREQERIKAEKERLEKERLEAEEKIRLEEERKRIEQERIERERIEAEQKETRIKAELEARRLEELRKVKEEEDRKKIEEEKKKRLEKELERKRLEEEKARKEKERKARIIEEKLREEKERIKKELEKNRKEEEKKQESKNRINEEIKRINRKVPMAKDIDNEVIIEASFTVDDFEVVEENTENYVNEIEVKIDSIIEEIIETKMNEVIVQIKKEIKERLKANNII